MINLRIHCFQHVDFEGLGCIEDWIKTNRHQLTYTKFFKAHQLPSIEDIDWLIVMGGPMGIYDYETYPYLKTEKTFIKKAIVAGKTVIGICLGAQLIADTLGATISANPEKEIGWFDIQKTTNNTDILKNTENKFNVFHWHGDTFSIPPNAERLFTSEGCKNQGFLYQNKVLGLQFHLEVTEESIKEMVKNGIDEIQKSPFVQSAAEILKTKKSVKSNNQIMFHFLTNLNQ